MFSSLNTSARIVKPWRRLKRERLGGATKPFHATDFEQSRPTMHQITGINAFMARCPSGGSLQCAI